MENHVDTGIGLPVGFILNKRYRIDALLAMGGFGITYRAWDLNLQQQLAIKEFYTNGTGSGWFFGAITFFFVNIIGKIGCVFVAVLLTLIGLGVFLVPFIPSLIEYARREREEDDEYEEEYEEEEEPEVKTRSSRRWRSSTVRGKFPSVIFICMRRNRSVLTGTQWCWRLSAERRLSRSRKPPFAATDPSSPPIIG